MRAGEHNIGGDLSECIDAHHHLWRYKKEEFPWISGAMDVLWRDYMLKDLSAAPHSPV
jgi:L-fuconolactonase